MTTNKSTNFTLFKRDISKFLAFVMTFFIYFVLSNLKKG